MASVLVVDDDEDDRLALARVLELAGHEVHTAASGREALEVFLAKPIRVVVTDIVMADGDGLDLITSLQSLRPNVAIIAVSGKGPEGLAVADAIGAGSVLTKPVDAAALVRDVNVALGLAEELEG